MNLGPNELVVGPPGSGKTIQAVKSARRLFGKCGIFAASSHHDLAELIGTYAVYDGFEDVLVVDKLSDLQRVVNYRSRPQITSTGKQREQDEINIVDQLVQAFVTQRGFGSVHEHPWLDIALTAAADAVVTQDLPLGTMESALDVEERAGILMNAPPRVRRQFGYFGEMSKLERERVLGAGYRLLKKTFRGPALSGRFDQPGEFLDLDEHFAHSGILAIDGSDVSEDQYRTVVLLLLNRIILGAMTHAYPLKIILDESTPLLNLWLVRKLEELRKFNSPTSLLMQSLPADPEIKDRLLQACRRHLLYCMESADIRQQAALDLIGVLQRNKVQWMEERYVSRRGPIELMERVTENNSITKSGKEERTTTGRGVTQVEKQHWDEFVQQIPHFESPQDQLFWLEQELSALKTGERFVKHFGTCWREQTKDLPRLYQGCPGLAQDRYQAALERIRSRPYFRTPADDAPCETKTAAELYRKKRGDGWFSRNIEKSEIKLLDWFENPSTARIWEPFGFKSQKACHNQLLRLTHRGKLRKVGEIKEGHGRPEDVFCTKKLASNVGHELRISQFVEAYVFAGARVLRGFDVTKPQNADAELFFGGEHFWVELDLGNEGLNQIAKQLKRYEKVEGWILFVCEFSQNIWKIKRIAEPLNRRILFTGLDRLHGLDTEFEDIHGNTTQI